MPRISRIVPLLAVLIGGVAVCWSVLRKGPLTIAINIPSGVDVQINGVPPQSHGSSSSSSNSVPPRVPSSKNTKSARRDAPKSSGPVVTAITAFHHYSHSALQHITHRRARFDKLPEEHLPLADAIGYTQHFSDQERGVKANAPLFRAIADNARELYGYTAGEQAEEVHYELVSDFMGHVVRDWSEEGAAERARIFPPILQALRRELAGVVGPKRVLVPGFGLGRLAHEIANDNDYIVDANELDYGSVIGYKFLVNKTTSVFQHTLYPFINKWTHQRSATGRFNAVRFPDMLPTSPVNLIEGNFLTKFPQAEQYDAVVSLFFIDVSENVIDFLANIHRLLKPGGLWVNLGPLKWGDHSQLQLSAEEVIKLAGLIGLDVDVGSHQSIKAVYAQQADSLLEFTYVTQFWTARKRV
ncbi:N2227-domain-containing protein [Artomyces pyxidatus]|uniref:N2227-domain-containing protein n=1 Tax=Artomyces pyxidatus TaxID=48021 RepID=A0ACB8SUI5_9AGAM|nr:N2227-domain-containing protein [Artomyces pyxidatus]